MNTNTFKLGLLTLQSQCFSASYVDLKLNMKDNRQNLAHLTGLI